MASLIDRSKWGIVFYGSTASPLPTYVDVNGQTQTAVQLVNATKVFMDPAIESAYFHVGSATRVSFLVEIGNISEEGDGCDLGVEGQFTGEADSEWPGVATFRNDDQETKAVHTFAAEGSYLLQTGNLGAIPTGRIATTPALTDGEDMEIIVYMRAE